MKLFKFVISSIIIASTLSCEKEADPIDFVDPSAIRDSLLGDVVGENKDTPSETNPILIGTFNGADFNAVRVSLQQETIGIDRILNMEFFDAANNRLFISIPDPITATYGVGDSSLPIFEADFTNSSTGESFTTRRTATSTSSTGEFILNYSVNGSVGFIPNAQFRFRAFLVTGPGTAPSKFVDFDSGSLTNLPVVIN